MRYVFLTWFLVLLPACGGGGTSALQDHGSDLIPSDEGAPDVALQDDGAPEISVQDEGAPDLPLEDEGMADEGAVEDPGAPEDEGSLDDSFDTGPTTDQGTDEGQVEDIFQPPALPEAPENVVLQASLVPSIVVQLEESALFLTALGAEGRLVQTADAVSHLQNSVFLEMEVPEGQIKTSSEHGESTLLATDQGLWIYQDGFIFESPVNELLLSPALNDVASFPAGGSPEGVWLLQDTTLYLWESNQLFTVSIDTLPWISPIIAHGAHFEGTSTLWVADNGVLSAMVPEEDSFIAIPVLEDQPISHLSSATDGILWAVSEGTLIKRHPDGQFEWFQFEEPITSLVRHHNTEETWLTTETQLILAKDGAFIAVENSLNLNKHAVLGAGTLLSSSDTLVVILSVDGSIVIEETTWSSDIEPLFQSKCAMCHTPNNIGADLSTPVKWQENIDEILLRVTVDMPANDPPLDPALVQLIQDWKDGGFLP